MKKNQNRSTAPQKEIFGGRFVLNEELSKKYDLTIYDDMESADDLLYILEWGECYTEEEIVKNLNGGCIEICQPIEFQCI